MRVVKLNRLTGVLLWIAWMAIVLNLFGNYVVGEREWHRETQAIAAKGLDSDPRAALLSVIDRSVARHEFAWVAGVAVLLLLIFTPLLVVALGLVVARKALDKG